MNQYKVPIMQTHLDFHTSPDITGIGSKFSKENFQMALKIGELESITVFAKCHHSMCYYPTKVGVMHPGLNFDLLGTMIDAAHEIGVRAPIYITAGWSDKDAQTHPEWRSVSKDGKYVTTVSFDESAAQDEMKEHCAWQMLCLNDGEYAQHIYDITREICENYPVDGLFYDISLADGGVCYCASCKKGMRELGLDIENEEDAKRYYVMKRQTFMKKCADIMRRYHPNATVFFNSGGADIYKPEFHEYQSHFEMEDLPTAWGGYDQLPIRAKYFVNTGKQTIGMTGKFHLDWGEFGGFKSKEALKYEVVSMAIFGAGASVGDHMHPDGEMELQTYENIGYAYHYLKRITPYCYGGESTANIGIYLSKDRTVNEGLSNILLQNQCDYNVIVNNHFAKYDTVLIPNGVVLDEDGIASLESYLQNGGKLLLMGDALVKDGSFQINIGLQYEGEPEFDCDYLVPLNPCDDLPNAPLLCNYPGHRTTVCDAQIYAEFITPYFKRTYAHFCGHKNTPHDKNSKSYPAIAKSGSVVYLSHPLSKQYFEYGSLYHRNYFMRALNLVYGGALLKVSGLGSQGRCTMIHQPREHRYCINAIYASPIRRGKAEIIEDILPINDIRFEIKIEQRVKNVHLPLTGEKLEFCETNGRVVFILPKLHCHTTVVIEY
ncbi:MAG: hypothetical protein IJN46_10405 [Lachnospiraceae bacterium]|nr:hypothetical protein [Lachnospiraceae bacterium]